jgi:hypothetical protein
MVYSLLVVCIVTLKRISTRRRFLPGQNRPQKSAIFLHKSCHS